MPSCTDSVRIQIVIRISTTFAPKNFKCISWANSRAWPWIDRGKHVYRLGLNTHQLFHGHHKAGLQVHTWCAWRTAKGLQSQPMCLIFRQRGFHVHMNSQKNAICHWLIEKLAADVRATAISFSDGICGDETSQGPRRRVLRSSWSPPWSQIMNLPTR